MSQSTLSWVVKLFVAVLVIQAVVLVWFGFMLFDHVTREVFSQTPPDIPGPGGTVAAYGTFFGVLSVVVVGMWVAAKKLVVWRSGDRGQV